MSCWTAHQRQDAAGVVAESGVLDQQRKVTKKHGAFPDTRSVEKVLYLAFMKAKERWTMPIKDWSNALITFTWLSQDG